MLAVIMRTLASAALVLAAATACGGTVTPTGAPPATTASSSAAPSTPAPPEAADRAAVEKAFDDYNRALLARDFATVCATLSPQAAQQVVTMVAGNGGQAGTCQEAFTAVYADPSTAALLDQAARSIRIDDIAVSGETATLTYSGEANGQRAEGLTGRLQRIDGRWRVAGTG